MTNRMAFAVRGCIAIATASLIGGVAHAQPGPTSGMAGGPSNGYAGTSSQPPASSGNTPVTGGGASTTTSKSARDEAQNAATSTQSNTGQLAGTVEQFDRSKRTLKLQGVDRTLNLDPRAEVTRNGSTAALSDIKEGDQVRASLSGSGDTVGHIDITSPGQSGTGTTSQGGGSSSGSTGSR